VTIPDFEEWSAGFLVHRRFAALHNMASEGRPARPDRKLTDGVDQGYPRYTDRPFVTRAKGFSECRETILMEINAILNLSA
jgi:hypothetical protein